ncbi:MAG: metallophosphoesterase, partial [Gemmatimonadaceae bacterium]
MHPFLTAKSILVAAALTAPVSGTVFVDRNGNGTRDATEPGLRGVAVSDQDHVVTTDNNGHYTIDAAGGSGIVFVSVPDGYRSKGVFFRAIGARGGAVDFPLTPAPHGATMTFVHASDTHISDASLTRTQRLRALVDSVRPDFVIITGDLVRDALRVSENEATTYYSLFQREIGLFRQPVWTVPGNHENFGIERDKSGVTADNPLYGRAMYHHYRGPDYYSFSAGGVHFVGLHSVDIDDTRYYGHVDSLQLAWLARDLAVTPAAMPVITFNHIPFFTSVETVNGYMDQPPAPS